MPYGIIKVDTVTFTDGGADKTVSISGLVQNPTFSGNITVTGTISGNVIRGGTTVSGATVTGTAGAFGTLTGNTAGFTTVTGTTVTGTTANFVTVSGTTVTGNAGQFTTVTGGTAGFTTVTGTTVTGTTANFVTVSGTTVTGGTAGFTTVTGTTITGTTLTVASGTFTGNSTAAAFIPTGSTAPTNGVYLPSANNVAISTNGTGRLTIDSSGNVNIDSGTVYVDAANNRLGVGTTSPAALFHARVGTDQNFTVTSTNSMVQLQAINNAANAFTPIDIAGSYIKLSPSSSEAARIDSSGTFIVKGAGTAGVTQAVSFNGSAPVNSMVLDSSGRLGIGTSSPGSLLHVAGTIGVGTSAAIIRRNQVSGSSPLRLQGNADDTVNDTNPGAYINVGGGTLTDGYEGNIDLVAYGNTAGVNRNNITFSTRSGANAITERVRITSAGNVGIGTISPGGTLDVKAAASTAPLVVQGPSSEFARIDSSGRLLVGTSTSIGSNAKVQAITGDLYCFEAYQTGANAYPAQFNFTKTRGTAGTFTVIGAEDYLGTIAFRGTDGSNIRTAAEIHAVVDGTPGANDMPGRLVFSTTADGASTPTERMKITSSGNVNITNGNLVFSTAGTGIDFSATANSSGTTTSELLSDYEEGTWTPTIIGSTTAGTVSYSNLNARYTKIGRQVFVETHINWSGGIGGSGGLNVSGLPFTTANVEIYPALSIGYWDSIAFSGSQVLALFGNAATYIYFYGVPTNGGTNIAVPWDSAGSMILSGSYTI